MTGVLSRSEVDSLFSTLDVGLLSSPLPPVAPAGGTAAHATREAARALRPLHDQFGRQFAAALGELLRTPVEVRLAGVAETTLGEFIIGLENPTCFQLIESAGLRAHLGLDLNLSMVFPIVDRLLGGGKAPAPCVPNRPLTEIELRLASRLSDLALRSLESAWSKVCDLRLKVVQVESNPARVGAVAPDEPVLLTHFEISMGTMCGIMKLGVPRHAIECASGSLAAAALSSTASDHPADASSVQMTVRLAQTALTANDVSQLAVGDVILTDQENAERVEVLLAGETVGYGIAGLLKGHRAVRLTGVDDRLCDAVSRVSAHCDAQPPPRRD
jgi:flagellar motor switch protein FliM